MAKVTKTINAVSYYLDGQDGGGTSWIFGSLERLQKERGISDERLQEILDEEDPYENGEISDTEIQVEVDTETLEVTLLGSIRSHWGQ